jgi:inositol phosphorylceramide mannosyltransferase catalytic subunit
MSAPPGMKIAKIIHQSWKNNRIPYNIYHKSWVDSWALLHPDWERKFWTDEDNCKLVRDHYPSFYECYQRLTPSIKKADFARLLYMHRFGGVYVDLDFLCLKTLNPLLQEYDIVLGRLSLDNPCYRIPNAFLASHPRREFWIQVAQEIASAAPEEQARVEMHTGPLRLEQAYDQYKPPNSMVYGGKLIYPLDWIDLLRPKKRQFVLELRKKTPQELANLFPRSYCLTFWMQNWAQH